MIHQQISIEIPNRGLEEPAKLYSYIIDNTASIDINRKRPAVIICPGGGYSHTSDREAEPIALRMMAGGYHAFVLRYHVAPTTYPVQLLELAASVKYVREHAKELNIDENHIVISGFSAGGHLAGSLAMFWTKDWLAKELHTTKEMIQPNGCLLCYPVITSGEFAHRDSFVRVLGDRYDELLDKLSLEKQVNVNTPPMFIWHTYTDTSVPVENSLLLVSALRKYNISAEFHMYPVGKHGLSLATEETMNSDGRSIQPECEGWIDLAIRWIKNLGGAQC